MAPPISSGITGIGGGSQEGPKRLGTKSLNQVQSNDFVYFESDLHITLLCDISLEDNILSENKWVKTL